MQKTKIIFDFEPFFYHYPCGIVFITEDIGKEFNENSQEYGEYIQSDTAKEAIQCFKEWLEENKEINWHESTFEIHYQDEKPFSPLITINFPYSYMMTGPEGVGNLTKVNPEDIHTTISESISCTDCLHKEIVEIIEFLVEFYKEREEKMRNISIKNYLRWQEQLLRLRISGEIEQKPGCYNVFIENRETGVIYETQGDIPDDKYYSWAEFLQWLVDDPKSRIIRTQNDYSGFIPSLVR